MKKSLSRSLFQKPCRVSSLPKTGDGEEEEEGEQGRRRHRAVQEVAEEEEEGEGGGRQGEGRPAEEDVKRFSFKSASVLEKVPSKRTVVAVES